MNLSEQFVAQMGKGRIPKFTEELKERFINAVKGGESLRSACLLVGIHESTFYAWQARGRRATRGPYFDFQEAVTRAMAESQRVLERVHHRLSTNGLILSKPRCKIIMTDKGAVIQTKEIDPGPDGKPVYADFWEELSPEAKVKAIEWELRFRDRRTYGDDCGSAGELGGATRDMRQAGQVVGVFAAALELMSQYRVTPVLMGPAIETTAKPVEE